VPIPETLEHREIKRLLANKLTEWFGVSVPEYYSSGHELDIFSATIEGSTIYIEIIWSDSRSHFLSDINMLQQSDADAKLVIASPQVLQNPEYLREYSKVVVSQRRYGKRVHGEMIDGARILSDRAYVEGPVRNLVSTLVNLGATEKESGTRQVVQQVEPPEDEYAPAKIQEQLISNLFPVLSFPETVYSVSTRADSAVTIIRKLRGEMMIPTFTIKEHRILTFGDLTNNSCPLLETASSDDVAVHRVSSWQTEPTRWAWVVELANIALKEYCKRHLGLFYDREKKRFIFLPNGISNNIVKWNPGTRMAARTVAKRFDGPGGLVNFWRQYSAKVSFSTIAQDMFLKVEPGFAFTKDGFVPIDSKRITSLSTQWMKREYNARYLYHVRFWIAYLARHGSELNIPTGGQRLEVSTEPVSTNLSYGVPGDNLSMDQMFAEMPEPFEEETEEGEST
jgi:hypothetical protein